MNARGFTLIELMIAVLLLALLSTGAVLSFRQPFSALHESAMITTVRQFDAEARAAARASGQPQRLIFDLDNHRLQRRDGNDFNVVRRQINLSETDLQLIVDGQSQMNWPVAIDIRANGWSRSYSVALAHHTLDVAGLTGQMTERR